MLRSAIFIFAFDEGFIGLQVGPLFAAAFLAIIILIIYYASNSQSGRKTSDLWALLCAFWRTAKNRVWPLCPKLRADSSGSIPESWEDSLARSRKYPDLEQPPKWWGTNPYCCNHSKDTVIHNLQALVTISRLFFDRVETAKLKIKWPWCIAPCWFDMEWTTTAGR